MFFRLPAMCFVLVLSAAAQSVRDPHASVVDVAAQQARFAAQPPPAVEVHSCLNLPVVAAPGGRMEIPHHYLQGSNGPINPAEAEATRPYNAFEDRVTAGMNQWLAYRKEAEAQCALAQLDSWAQAGALLDYDPKASSQSWFQAEWTLSSLGVADSVLVNDPGLDRARQARVNEWLHRAVVRLLSFDKPHGQNHHYWRGLAATSIGVATNDSELFARGITIFKEAVDEIDERGAFPQEMVRHENAIHYQAFALQPLLLLAAFAERQGVGLYAYDHQGRTIRNAIVFLGKVADDPSLLQPYTTDPQRGPLTAADFLATAFFVARFGPSGLPPKIAASLTAPARDTRLGGAVLLLVPEGVAPSPHPAAGTR